ncbi:MAG: DUF192 domain-containing protein [Planctomycetes bacterium]|nr:DUF192 domain-containing protein [Planctomycetota bacterium]
MTRRNAWPLPLAALSVAVLLACCNAEERPMQPPTQPPTTAVLQLAGRSVTVELALDSEARARGMMHRTHLDPDAGMLFVFPEARPQRFWMRNTLIPLDICFLDSDGTLQNVARGLPGVEEPGYHSARPARMVLELNAGWCEAHGIKPGDRVPVPPEIVALGR